MSTSANTSTFGYFPQYSGVSTSGLNTTAPSTTKLAPELLAAAGNQTIAASTVIGGFLQHDPSGGPSTATYPTAAELIALIGNKVGTCIEFTHRNIADAAETITVAPGAGMTMSCTLTIAQNQQKTWKIVVTGATTVNAYSMGAVTF